MQIKCPTCDNLIVWEETPYRPFCSEKCKLIDLGAWASEKYRVELKEKSEKLSPLDPTDAALRNGQEG